MSKSNEPVDFNKKLKDLTSKYRFALSVNKLENKVKEESDKVPTKTSSPKKEFETNESIYRYLMKIGEVEIADKILDILTAPENKKTSEEKFYTDENIKKLSIINNNILEKLTQLEKDRVDEQISQAQNTQSEIQKPKLKDDKAFNQGNETKNGTNSWMDYVINALEGYLGYKGLKAIWGRMATWTKESWARLSTFMKDGWGAAKEYFQKELAPMLESLWTKTKTMGEDILEKSKSIIESTKNAILETFKKSMTWITETISKIPNIGSIMDGATNFINKGIEAAKGGIDIVGSKIGSIIGDTGALKDAANIAGSKLTSIGSKLFSKNIVGAVVTSGVAAFDYNSQKSDLSGTGISNNGSKMAWNTAFNLVGFIDKDLYNWARYKFNQDEKTLMTKLAELKAIRPGYLEDWEIINWDIIANLTYDDLKVLFDASGWDSDTKSKLKQLLTDKYNNFQDSWNTAMKNQTANSVRGNYGVNQSGSSEAYFEPGVKKLSTDLSKLDKVSIEGYQDIKARIKKSEGLILHPYTDSRGNMTIGYGHLMVGDDFTRYPMGQDISKEEAEALFESDFAKHYKQATMFPNFSSFSDGVQNALIDMTYNMGGGWWNNWPMFVNELASGDFETAAKNIMESNYHTQVGNRAEVNAKLIQTAGLNKANTSKETEAQKSIQMDVDMYEGGKIKKEFDYVETAKNVGDANKLKAGETSAQTSLDSFIKANPQNDSTGVWNDGIFTYNDTNTQAKYKVLSDNLVRFQKAGKYLQDVQEKQAEEAQAKKPETEQEKLNREIRELDLTNKGDKKVNEANGSEANLIKTSKEQTKTETTIVDNTGNINISNKEINDQSLEEIFILK